MIIKYFKPTKLKNLEETKSHFEALKEEIELIEKYLAGKKINESMVL